LTRQFQEHLPARSQATELGEEELESLKAQYTMVDERQAHDQILIPDSTPPTPKMSAIDFHEGKPEAANAKDGGLNLGDNVELF